MKAFDALTTVTTCHYKTEVNNTFYNEYDNGITTTLSGNDN